MEKYKKEWINKLHQKVRKCFQKKKLCDKKSLIFFFCINTMHSTQKILNNNLSQTKRSSFFTESYTGWLKSPFTLSFSNYFSGIHWNLSLFEFFDSLVFRISLERTSSLYPVPFRHGVDLRTKVQIVGWQEVLKSPLEGVAEKTPSVRGLELPILLNLSRFASFIHRWICLNEI